MEKRKERRAMYETTALAIWFSSIIAGMITTMLMPHIYRESTGNGERKGQLVRMPSEADIQRHRTSMVGIERAA
jgi:hypothetical protein